MTAAEPGRARPGAQALGLSGMLDTLEARLAEARAGTLGHAGLLQVLCEDELARRDAAKITRRIKAARFPPEATFETFDFGYNPKLPAAEIRDLARLEFIAAGEGILAYGPVGVGKATWRPRWATRPAAAATTSPSPPAPGCWPSWRAGTPTAASTPASASLSSRRAHRGRLRDAGVHRRPGRRPV